jgi:hypothetical protein
MHLRRRSWSLGLRVVAPAEGVDSVAPLRFDRDHEHRRLFDRHVGRRPHRAVVSEVLLEARLQLLDVDALDAGRAGGAVRRRCPDDQIAGATDGSGRVLRVAVREAEDLSSDLEAGLGSAEGQSALPLDPVVSSYASAPSTATTSRRRPVDPRIAVEVSIRRAMTKYLLPAIRTRRLPRSNQRSYAAACHPAAPRPWSACSERATTHQLWIACRPASGGPTPPSALMHRLAV